MMGRCGVLLMFTVMSSMCCCVWSSCSVLVTDSCNGRGFNSQASSESEQVTTITTATTTITIIQLLVFKKHWQTYIYKKVILRLFQ